MPSRCGVPDRQATIERHALVITIPDDANAERTIEHFKSIVSGTLQTLRAEYGQMKPQIEQAIQAAVDRRKVIDGEDVFVSTTVVLETEWVLRSVYGYDSAQVCAALRAFAGLPRVSLEDPALVATALDRTAQGLDFADALHLGRAEDCDVFVTFDQPFIRAAQTAGIRNVRTP